MAFYYLVAAVAAILGVAECAAGVNAPRGLVKRQHTAAHNASSQIKLPDWNYANATTKDATADGSVGVILEDDIVEGNPGKDGATVKRVRVGPYTILGGTAFEGRLFSFAAPCADCFITAMQLSLEYKDGKRANVDTGAWCHHIDLTVPGVDYTCPTSLATLITVKDPAMGGRRIFSGGNERVPVRLNTKRKYGIEIGKRVRMGGSMELMNENKKPMTVYMILLFEFLPKTTPGYKPATLVWVDVTNCARKSDFKAKEGTYEMASREFPMKHDTYLLSAIGHLHDGGTKVELYVNGNLSCTSKQIYANRRGGYTESTDGTIIESMVMPPGTHISDVGVCKDWGEVKKGDKLTVKGYFNDTEHMQMKKASGKLDDQMGIMWTYVGFK